MIGSATSSIETSRNPCQVTAFILVLRLAPVVPDQMQLAGGPICSMPPSTTHDLPSRNRPMGSRERRSPPRLRWRRPLDRVGCWRKPDDRRGSQSMVGRRGRRRTRGPVESRPARSEVTDGTRGHAGAGELPHRSHLETYAMARSDPGVLLLIGCRSPTLRRRTACSSARPTARSRSCSSRGHDPVVIIQ